MLLNLPVSPHSFSLTHPKVPHKPLFRIYFAFREVALKAIFVVWSHLMIICAANHVCHAEFGCLTLPRSLHSASENTSIEALLRFVFKTNSHRIQMWNASPHVLRNTINPEDLICCPGGWWGGVLKLQITL